MLSLLITVPLQFACQLVGPGNSTHGNFTIVSNTPSLEQRPTAELPEGYVAFPDVGAAYKLYKNPTLIWNEARKKCISEGGTLAVIDSRKKVDHVSSVFDNERTPFVGIHNLYNTSEWTSVKSGLPLTSLPWTQSMQDPQIDFGGCAILFFASGLEFRQCDLGYSYMCEIPISENGRRLLPIPT